MRFESYIIEICAQERHNSLLKKAELEHRLGLRQAGKASWLQSLQGYLAIFLIPFNLGRP